MTTPRDEVWVCWKTTRANAEDRIAALEHDARGDCVRDELADAIRAALERTEQPWVGVEFVDQFNRRTVQEYYPGPGQKRVLVVPLEEEPK